MLIADNTRLNLIASQEDGVPAGMTPAGLKGNQTRIGGSHEREKSIQCRTHSSIDV